MCKLIHQGIVKFPKYMYVWRQHHMLCINSIVKNLLLNLRKEKYMQSIKKLSCPVILYQMFACQLRVMEMKIVTTEAGAVRTIFSPGHLQV